MTQPFDDCDIPGAGLLRPPFMTDARGSFTKPFSGGFELSPGRPFAIAEVFWSSSELGVVRGLHFQNPPTAVAKIVFVVTGAVRDVVLYLRVGSPTFGRHSVFELHESSGAVVVPAGCAHGFEVVEGPAVTCYLQDGPFDPLTDTGIRWDSCGVEWTTDTPLLSERDRALPPLDDVLSLSPFRLDGATVG